MRPQHPFLHVPPQWLPRSGGLRPIAHADFAEQRYWNNRNFGADFDAWLNSFGSATYSCSSSRLRLNGAGVLESIAANRPRFEHDVTAPYRRLGLRHEGASTNLALQSQTLGTSWTAGNVSVTADQSAAPDSTTTGDLITETAGTAHQISQAQTIVAGTTYCLSFFVRPGTCLFPCLRVTSNGTAQNFVSVVFNLSGAGSVGETKLGTSSGTLIASAVTAYPGGWYRISIAVSIGLTDGLISLGFAHAASSNTFTTFGAVTIASGGLTMTGWGAQFEANELPSSYIVTTTGSVARAAENFALPIPLDPNFTFAEGTLVARVILRHLTVANDMSILTVGTSTNRDDLYFRGASVGPRLVVVDSGSQANFGTGTVVANQEFGVAAAFQQDNFALSFNGSAVATDTSGTVPSAPGNSIQIGHRAAATDPLYGIIRSMTYWPKRLDNSELIRLSAAA